MITYLKLISDVHNDGRVARFKKDYTPIGNPETDKKTLLVVAGDIGNGKNWQFSADWLLRLGKRYRHVVAVLGNHDYWGGDINDTVKRFKQHLGWNQTIPNVHLIQNETLILENVKLVGGTMWTDMDKRNPIVMSSARQIMTPDFSSINMNGVGISPDDMVRECEYTTHYIFEKATRDHVDQKVIVVTHHAPTYHSIHERYRTARSAMMNHYFYNDCEHRLHSSLHDIDYWLHGHVHDPFDYVVDRTRVICNPAGYVHETNGFKEDFLEKL
ncbi:hypothetical protein RsoM2USA_179 [Ralstonia phage RsoM2USA]|nr:hypothetical protein RsoM2USA_179 [Ralstonia phage RsoM2USA]